MTAWAVVPAAGIGRRMGGDLPKQYLPLAGRTVLEHSLAALLDCPRIAGVVVVTAAADPYWARVRGRLPGPVIQAEGGAERCHSVRNGLAALAGWAEAEHWVLVHDAARPCLRPENIDRLMDELAHDPVGGLLAAPALDTMKRSDADGRVTATVDRVGLWHAQTPQMFRYELLVQALDAALAAGRLVTDEAAALEAAGHAPRLVEGHSDNFKITRPGDLALAEFHLGRRTHAME